MQGGTIATEPDQDLPEFVYRDELVIGFVDSGQAWLGDASAENRHARVAWVPNTSGRGGGHKVRFEPERGLVCLDSTSSHRRMAAGLLAVAALIFAAMLYPAVVDGDYASLKPVLVPGLLAALGIYVWRTRSESVQISRTSLSMRVAENLDSDAGVVTSLDGVWAVQAFQRRVHMPRKDRGTRRVSVLSVLELHFVFEDGRRLHIVDMDDLAQGRAFARHVAGFSTSSC